MKSTSEKALTILANLENRPYLLEMWEGNQWKRLLSSSGSSGVSPEFELTKNKYRLFLFGNGYYTSKEFEIGDHIAVPIFVETKDITQNCIEEFPNMNLTVQYCPDNVYTSDVQNRFISWRELSNLSVMLKSRFISVGIEFTKRNVGAKISKFGNKLLETGSIDVLYSIQTQFPFGEYEKTNHKAWNMIKYELTPYYKHNQLIVWSYGLKYDQWDIHQLQPSRQKN